MFTDLAVGAFISSPADCIWAFSHPVIEGRELGSGGLIFSCAGIIMQLPAMKLHGSESGLAVILDL